MIYKDDVTPLAAYEAVSRSQKAYIIDVRTTAEWAFVGIPDVDNLIRLEWQHFPSMQMNENFAEQIAQAGVNKDAQLYLLCRSGARSAAAAGALTAAGYKNCYNISSGFEGDKDDQNHRSRLNGWKFDGLPWKQK